MSENEQLIDAEAPVEMDDPSISGRKVSARDSVSHLSRRSFLRAAFGSVATFGSLGIYGSQIEPREVHVERLDIKIAGWPASAAGLRIGQISDLHCHSKQSLQEAEKAVKVLMDQKPDVVFVTGDLVTARTGDWIHEATRTLKPLTQAKLGVYSILGNHDWASGNLMKLVVEQEKIGIPVLRNKSVPMPTVKNVWIVGLDDFDNNHSWFLPALHHVPDDAVKLLLVHEPDYADYSPRGFALQFSGHSHGGQIRIPGMPPFFTPRNGRHYPEGLRQAKYHRVYTSRGVGMIHVPVRICCPPEVNLLRIYPV